MDGMWCFVGRTVARSVGAAGGHDGEKKEREGWLQEKPGRKSLFCQFCAPSCQPFEHENCSYL